ncbi:hypothetical protein NQ317_007717 [Molorchus minor]|uniref:MADF domain-containing protein n=1 Tax=Molorchus minor TaxID=1323400 RepID=A0ABQ9IQP2_9CUCU|nr:hypothetical protein NQ317_007717 [Molorchus minor]
MCDTENLITAVEKYPCLWNVSHESYHDRDIKDLAWEQVCLEIVKDWDNTNDEEKKKKCVEIKKKWNNVRDCYRRDVNKVKHAPTGSGAKKQKKYVYTDLLTFLAPIMQSRRHEGNYDDGGEGTSTDGTREEEDSQNSIVEDYIAEEIPHNAKKKKGTKKRCANANT